MRAVNSLRLMSLRYLKAVPTNYDIFLILVLSEAVGILGYSSSSWATSKFDWAGGGYAGGFSIILTGYSFISTASFMTGVSYTMTI